MAILEIRNVSSGYGEVQILWGVTLALEDSKLTSLVGGNGCGQDNFTAYHYGLA
jgi:branched-chain amino acid transport system ATP-binding protein